MATRPPPPPSAVPGRRNLSTINRALVILGLVLMIPLAATRTMRIVTNFSKPSEITYPNSLAVLIARFVKNGEPIYRDFRQVPHFPTTYGPLFYAVPGLLARLLDADELGIFRIGRSLSLAATLGSLAVLWALLRRERADPAIALLMVVLYGVAAEITWPCCLASRPDAAEMFFTVLGLAMVVHAGRSSRWLYGALALFLTAFLFKQSAVVAPAATAAYLYGRGHRREAIRFGAAGLVCFGLVVAALQLATDGLYFLNTVVGLRCHVTWTNPATVGGPVLSGNYPIVVLALTAVVTAWLGRGWSLYAIFFLLHLAFATAGTLRDGSAANYFLQTLAIGTVLAGGELARLLGPDASPGRDRRAAAPAAGSTPGDPAHGGNPRAALVALMVILVFLVARLCSEAAAFGETVEAFQRRGERNLAEAQYLQQTARRLDALGGPILSQYDPINLYARHAFMADLLAFSCYADQGVFDDREIIDMITQQRFAAIVLRFPASESTTAPRYQSTAWFRDEWLRALRGSAYRETLVGELYIYTPIR